MGAASISARQMPWPTLVTAHTGAKVHSEQTIPGLHGNPSQVLNPKEHAQTSCSTCADTSRQSAPAEATWPNWKGRKSSTDTLASTWPARTNVHQTLLFSDADHPPTAIRDAWAAIPDHPAQTTTPSRHHLTPGSSSPPFHTHPSRELTTHNIPCHTLMPDTRSSTSMADHHQSLRSSLWSHRAADVGYTQRELKGRAHAPGLYRLRGKARGTCR